MHPLIQVGHDRAQMCFQFGPADRRDFVGFERQRKRPDANGFARFEQDKVSAEDLFVADQAAIDADVLQLELAVFARDHGMAF